MILPSGKIIYTQEIVNISEIRSFDYTNLGGGVFFEFDIEYKNDRVFLNYDTYNRALKDREYISENLCYTSKI